MIARVGVAGAAAIIGTFLAYTLLIIGMGYGLDLSDETFYLIWLHNPQAYALNYQPFAYILNPFYRLVGESLILFRFLGIAVSAAVGAILGASVSKFYSNREIAFDTRGFAFVGALAAALNYLAWFLTPNYNTLANWGAMLALAGWMRWFDRRAYFAAFLIGIGIAVSFFGKPPLAVIESVVSIALAYRAPHRVRVLLLAGAIAFVVTLIAIGAFENPIDMLANAIESQRVLSLGTGIRDLPGRTYRELMASQAVLPACAAAALLSFSRSGLVDVPRKGLQALGLFAIGFFSLRIFGLFKGDEGIDLIGFSAICFGLVLLAARRANLERETLLPVVAFLFTPFAISLGTYNPLLTQLSVSAGFVLLAIATLARFHPRWLAIEIATYTLAVLLLTYSWYFAQGRGASQRGSNESITLPQTATHIRVDQRTADYQSKVSKIGRMNGITASTPIVDLSGGAPATAIFLGGQAPVLPWILKITPQWPDVVWSRMSANDRERAWIIGPIHPAFANTNVVRSLRSQKERYDEIGEAWLPTFEQRSVIYKPHPTLAPL